MSASQLPQSTQSGSDVAWTSYTPTWTNVTVGNGTVTASWSRTGRRIDFQIDLLWGSTTSYSNVVIVSLPVTAAAKRFVVNAHLLDSGTRNYFGFGVIGETDANTITMHHPESGGSGNVVPLSPFTWATNDRLSITGFYEAAAAA